MASHSSAADVFRRIDTPDLHRNYESYQHAVARTRDLKRTGIRRGRPRFCRTVTENTEGIGQGRITGNLEDAPIDDAYRIGDEEALPIVFDLLKEEGLCLGGSSGINVAGAIRMARDLGPGHTIVTVLCDLGTRYQSKLFNPEFLRGKGLPVPEWLA